MSLRQPDLHKKTCLVTGATQGIGRGIALQLGQAGAKVYITGRTKDKLESVAEEIRARGGKAVPVVVDHEDDKQVEALFTRVKQETHGRLDLLVNNAFAGVAAIADNRDNDFYTLDPVVQWDSINGVGLRGHYLCSTYAARMMVENKSGLIVNVSSPGGLRYLFNVSYGVGKAAVDRMAQDMAVQLKKSNVATVSLWPGPANTEKLQARSRPASASVDWANAESTEFAGMAVAHLASEHAADPAKVLANKSGRVLLTPDLALEYGYVDLDGGLHDFRSLSYLLGNRGYTWLATAMPSFVRVPLTAFHYMGYKF